MSLKGQRRGWAEAAGAALSSRQLGIAGFFSWIEAMAAESYLERSGFRTKRLLHRRRLGAIRRRWVGQGAGTHLEAKSGVHPPPPAAWKGQGDRGIPGTGGRGQSHDLGV